MSTLNFKFSEEFIKKQLLPIDSPERLLLEHHSFTKSAILFLILPRQDKPYDLVMIRRAVRATDKHSGEMAFPGGHPDPRDKSLIETALRECEEEIGIPREKVKVLGSFDDHITPKGYIITPIVGYLIEDYRMKKQEEEVDEIVKIPINFFANKRNYQERTYLIGSDIIEVGKYNYRTQEGKKYVIFGASCHIIVDFIQKVYGIQLMSPEARRLNCEDIEKRISQKFVDNVKKTFIT
ncbi:MAG: NUDIX hydrolase [Promethearchaeota archaeon]